MSFWYARWFRGLLVAATTMIATTGFAAFTGSSGEEAGLPMPAVGDRAVYDVEMLVVSDEPAPFNPLAQEIRVEWGVPAETLDETFTQRDAWPLFVEIDHRQGSDILTQRREAYYDASTGEALHDVIHFQSETPTATGTETTTFQRKEYFWNNGPCGFLTPAHGGGLGEELVIEGQCGWIQERSPTMFHRVGTDADGIHYQADGRPLHIWYRPDLPVPVRIQVPWADYFTTNSIEGRILDARLTDFEPGEARLEYTPAAATTASYGTLTPVPRPVHGIDDSGVSVPLPLSLAYDTALTETSSGMAEFLSAHPDAYMGYAWLNELRDPNTGDPHQVWSMAVTDGTDALGVQVYREPAGGPVFLPGASGYELRVAPWELNPDVADIFPDPERVPDMLPRAADVMAHAASVHADEFQGRTPNHYGFQTLCYFGCDEPITEVSGGYMQERREVAASADAEALLQGFQYVTSTLRVTETGLAAQDYYIVQDLPPAVQASTQAGNVASEPYTAPGALQIDAGEAALAASAAASIGVLYYFWPALRIAGVSLFTRIRSDEVLDHPVRARLLDIVEAEPGIHMQQLGRRAHVGSGALRHHLGKMVQADRIIETKSEGFTCFYPPKVDRRVMRVTPLLKAQTARQILAIVEERPDLSLRQLAARIGRSPGTVAHHLRRLDRAGVVRIDDEGERRVIHITPVGANALAFVRERRA